jgi:hypothetical protein
VKVRILLVAALSGLGLAACGGHAKADPVDPDSYGPLLPAEMVLASTTTPA